MSILAEMPSKSYVVEVRRRQLEQASAEERALRRDLRAAVRMTAALRLDLGSRAAGEVDADKRPLPSYVPIDGGTGPLGRHGIAEILAEQIDQTEHRNDHLRMAIRDHADRHTIYLQRISDQGGLKQRLEALGFIVCDPIPWASPEPAAGGQPSQSGELATRPVQAAPADAQDPSTRAA